MGFLGGFFWVGFLMPTLKSEQIRNINPEPDITVNKSQKML
jgi:hypothetical protein